MAYVDSGKMERVFLWLPIETVIYERQKEYYQAINAANTKGESTVFAAFMLEVIRDLLLELAKDETEGESIEDRILTLLRQNAAYSAKRLSVELGISERQVQRVMRKLKDAGAIERSGSNRNGTWIVH